MLGIADRPYMLLLKPMYGQTDAPRSWYLEARDRMLATGMAQHPLDPCLLLATDDAGRLVGGINLHVDDMLVAGDNYSFASYEAKLKARFSSGCGRPCLPRRALGAAEQSSTRRRKGSSCRPVSTWAS